jgi:hypothetical protein
MATQPQTIVKQRTLQSIESEMEALVELHVNIERELMALMQERYQMLWLMRGGARA